MFLRVRILLLSGDPWPDVVLRPGTLEKRAWPSGVGITTWPHSKSALPNAIDHYS